MPEPEDKKISFRFLTPENLIEKETPSEETTTLQEKTGEAEKTTQPEAEKKLEEIELFFRPKEIVPPPQPPKTTAEGEAKKKRPYFVYLGIVILIIIGAGSIIIFKPYEKLKTLSPFLQKETTKTEETKTEETALPKTSESISLPKVQRINPLEQKQPLETPEQISTAETSSETTSITETSPETTTETTTALTETTSTETSQTTETQEKPFFIYPTKEFSFLKNFPTKEIKLKSLSFDEFKKQLESFLKKQEPAGSIVYVKFTSENKSIPLDFVFDYFVKPSKISSEKLKEFKNEFSGNFALLIYYSYTRKNPLLIFEIKNSGTVKNFNKNWEKMGMVDDLKTLFWGVNPGKPLTNSFLSKKINELEYRLINFNNNYQILWSVTSQFLIYTSTETGFKKIIPSLK